PPRSPISTLSPYTTLFRSGRYSFTHDPHHSLPLADLHRPVSCRHAAGLRHSNYDAPADPEIDEAHALVVEPKQRVETLGPDKRRDRKSTRLNSSHVKISYA